MCWDAPCLLVCLPGWCNRPASHARVWSQSPICVGPRSPEAAEAIHKLPHAPTNGNLRPARIRTLFLSCQTQHRALYRLPQRLLPSEAVHRSEPPHGSQIQPCVFSPAAHLPVRTGCQHLFGTMLQQLIIVCNSLRGAATRVLVPEALNVLRQVVPVYTAPHASFSGRTACDPPAQPSFSMRLLSSAVAAPATSPLLIDDSAIRVGSSQHLRQASIPHGI